MGRHVSVGADALIGPPRRVTVRFGSIWGSTPTGRGGAKAIIFPLAREGFPPYNIEASPDY